MEGDHRPRAGGLLTTRAVLVLLCAVLGACIVGGLTYWQIRSVPGGLLAGLGAFGAIAKILHDLID